MSIITLISGANQGIGLATATRLAKEYGHHVIIGSRNVEAGVKVAQSLQAEGLAASSVHLDINSDETIAAAVKMIEAQFGRLDVLINNAGILIDGKVPDLSARELFNQTLTTNVTGSACLTEAMLPLLRKSANPRLVFVSSRMGSLHQATVTDTPFYAIDYKAYDASKSAVNMLALNYARIFADIPGARVNVACPGLVATSMTGHTQYGAPPETGAQRIVELATLDKSGPTATFSDSKGVIAW